MQPTCVSFSPGFRVLTPAPYAAAFPAWSAADTLTGSLSGVAGTLDERMVNGAMVNGAMSDLVSERLTFAPLTLGRSA